MPDVSHRGGEPGFLIYDAAAKRIEWTEYLGDGMFVSVGNIRALSKFTLLVLDLDSGDAPEIYGSGDYQNIRTSRKQRIDPLVQSKEPYPIQGRMLGSVEEVCYLHQLCHPRQIIEKTARVTCASSVADQFPA
jgi:hypothetical protein